MPILASAPLALLQQIRLCLTVAALPKKQNQLSSIKNNDNGYACFGILGTVTTNRIVSNCCSTVKVANAIKLHKTTVTMALIASAPWALLQQIRLFLTVAALPKKQNQLSFIKNSDNGFTCLGCLGTAATNQIVPICC
jgi:hypothetical protein